jgi:hypothetical protein
MTNVIGFPKREASTSERDGHQNNSASTGGISAPDDYWPNLASQIRGVACDLILAIDELQQDGYRTGSAAVDFSLRNLAVLHRLWFDRTRPRPWGEDEEVPS